MSLDSLNNRIDKLLRAVQQQQSNKGQPPAIEEAFKFFLLSEQEQARLKAFLAVISGKVHWTANGKPELKAFSNEELAELKNWLMLERALDSEDLASALEYRNLLTSVA